VLYYAQLAVKVQADDIHDEDSGEREYNDNGVYRFVTVAMISVYSRPDPELLQRSTQTVWSCKHEGEQALKLVDVKSIQSVVAMIPHRPTLPSGVEEERFFLLEKPGLGLVTVEEDIEEDEDE